jgi:hypothetical protein
LAEIELSEKNDPNLKSLVDDGSGRNSLDESTRQDMMTNETIC